MIQQYLIRILLSPFALLYGIGVSIREMLYRIGILKSVRFDIPTISVGNLSIGGAGKTPHIEYLVRLLRGYINVSTLSRGYQRKTKGYLEVQPNNTASQVGDEPLQFKRKFPQIPVIVSESRTFAVPQIMGTYPRMQCILLDDAFQHRAIQPALNILLTEFSHPFTKDWLLPAGRLREPRKSYNRANALIVTKCPPVLSEKERARMMKDLDPYQYQEVFFSYYKYQAAYHILQPRMRVKFEKDIEVLLICAIAGSDYLVKHLETEVESVASLVYEDHHFFTKYDLGNLKSRFNQLTGSKKIIITTEKDAMRLLEHRQFIIDNKLPVFVLPIEVAFHDEDQEKFDHYIKDFLLNFKS